MSEEYIVKKVIKEQLVHQPGQLKVSLVNIEKRKRSVLLTARGNPPRGDAIEIQSSDGAQYRVWIKKDSVPKFIECFFSILKHAQWNEFENLDSIISLAKNKSKINQKDLESFLLNPDNFTQIKNYIEHNLTEEDIVAIGYRKKQLERFSAMLKKEDLVESDWQEFFEKNEWIFGHGLDYRFNQILETQPRVGISEDSNGKGDGYSDFMIGDDNFLAFVEIKKSSARIFSELSSEEKKNLNRNGNWKLGSEFLLAYSQTLEQKAQAQVNYFKSCKTGGNNIENRAYDPKVILIIGNWRNELEKAKNDDEKEIKKRTFELFRRNSRNVEVITFDELYRRASHLVNLQALPKKKSGDGIPF
jgi:hypothetical protein